MTNILCVLFLPKLSYWQVSIIISAGALFQAAHVFIAVALLFIGSVIEYEFDRLLYNAYEFEKNKEEKE